MKTKLLSLALIGLLLVPAGVLAQQNNQPLTTTEATTTETTQTRAEAKQDAEAKLEIKRQEVQEQMTSARRERIINKCEGALNRLRTAKTNADEVYGNRTNGYNKLIGKLENLADRVTENNDISPLALETDIATLKTMIEEFFSDFDVYVVTMEQISTSDNCTSEPEVFHELLETAKTLRAELKVSAQAIRSFVSENIKQELNTLKEELKTQAATQTQAGQTEEEQ